MLILLVGEVTLKEFRHDCSVDELTHSAMLISMLSPYQEKYSWKTYGFVNIERKMLADSLNFHFDRLLCEHILVPVNLVLQNISK